MKRTMFSIFKTFAYNSFDMYIFLLFIVYANGQDSAQYLESAIKDLTNLYPRPSQRRMDHIKTIRKPTMPVFQTNKGQLAHLYQSALSKGDTVKIQSDDGSSPVDAAIYEIDDGHKHEISSSDDDSSAYYFYYYPLKAFLDELTSSAKPPEMPPDHHVKEYDADSSDTFVHHDVATMKPPGHQFHTHTHEHNIHIMEAKPTEPSKKPHKLEPLFMAISGFIGMTLMFVLSALILPKFSALKPRGAKESDVTGMMNVIFKAIEGYDCSERFACEFGKTARAFNMHNNRFVKLIRRIGPYSLSKTLYDINKYSNKKYKCAVIQCKMKQKMQSKKSKQKG